MRKIAFIGHSHAVAIFDGISRWRHQVSMDGTGGDSRYTEAFQGWFSIDTGRRLFELEPLPQFPIFTGAQASLITDRTFRGQLATVTATDGGARIDASDFLAGFIEQVSGFDAVISVLHGNEHALLGLINNLPEYDFAPFCDPPQGQPIDASYIDLVANRLVGQVVTPVTALRNALPEIQILHVPPPPPLHNPKQASVLEILNDDIEHYGLVRPELGSSGTEST